jgi:hypothetical protein
MTSPLLIFRALAVVVCFHQQLKRGFEATSFIRWHNLSLKINIFLYQQLSNTTVVRSRCPARDNQM